MQLIPAVDLHGGKCVRLLMGEREKETVYSRSPAEMALKWQDEGAERLHVVDLDGAFEGAPANTPVIAEITTRLTIPVQLGGGMRSREIVEKAFELGIERVILGTVAVEEPQLVRRLVQAYGERIMVGIDARDGIVAIKGWVQGSGIDAVEFALSMQEYGVQEIIYTDISRDGTLHGPNIFALETLARSLEIPVIASGGISSLEDLQRVKELASLGVGGVIVGQALYAGRFTLREALAALQGENGKTGKGKRQD